METKLKIRIGEIELDFQGSEEFIKADMQRLLTNVSEIASKIHPPESNHFQDRINGHENPPTNILGTTNSIAAKLKVTSGPDLIMAAAAHLSFVKGLDKFHRKDILESLKSATTYYRQSYAKNLTSYLDNLLKSGQLTEQSNDVYAIPATIRQKLESSLA
jgi:hypothetical protein